MHFDFHKDCFKLPVWGVDIFLFLYLQFGGIRQACRSEFSSQQQETLLQFLRASFDTHTSRIQKKDCKELSSALCEGRNYKTV